MDLYDIKSGFSTFLFRWSSELVVWFIVLNFFNHVFYK